MTVMVERRRHPRRETALVMELVCPSVPGNGGGRFTVLTGNISAGGAFFRTPQWRELPVGGRAKFAILLPSPSQGENWHCFRLSGLGTVTRHHGADHTTDSDWRGVALSFDRPLGLR